MLFGPLIKNHALLEDWIIMLSVLLLIIDILTLLILARVLVSWLPMFGIRIDPYNPIIRFLFTVTDPLLEPIRRYTSAGMVDFSPDAIFIS